MDGQAEGGREARMYKVAKDPYPLTPVTKTSLVSKKPFFIKYPSES